MNTMPIHAASALCAYDYIMVNFTVNGTIGCGECGNESAQLMFTVQVFVKFLRFIF